MKTKKLWTILAVAAGFTFAVTSCSDKSTVATDAASTTIATDAALTATTTDEAQASSLSDAVVSTADTYVNTVASNNYSSALLVKGEAETSTVTITVDKKDSVSFPKTITVDFGTTGYIDTRNDTLKGKIIITLSDKIWKPQATRTIKLVDFYVNGNNIKGTKSVVNNGLNAAKNPSITVTVSDTIVRVDKSTIIRNASHTRERISDGGTPKIFWDDEFSITGGATGVNAKGVTYTVLITKPLIIYNNYPFFVQGTVTTTTETRTATLDYGDGTKDRKATLTINGVTKDIILKH